MAKNKRWGKPYEDNREWPKYNEHLVQRGEFYLSLEFIAVWDTELSRMNAHKRGRHYLYPAPFIQWVAAIHVLFSMPYRQMEGFLRKLSPFVQQDLAADYTTLFRRIRLFELPVSDTIGQTGKDVVVAIDSTGIKVTNRSEWMGEKWRVHRGWIEVGSRFMLPLIGNPVISWRWKLLARPFRTRSVVFLLSILHKTLSSLVLSGRYSETERTIIFRFLTTLKSGTFLRRSRFDRMLREDRRVPPIGLNVPGSSSMRDTRNGLKDTTMVRDGRSKAFSLQ
ncbi:MAG: hypothetical protein METHP_00123 [Methanoregula sp. SKADARSKE-2]|nr:MAG: hypothetical protein METHP_00123 [Methanoregula sp. SKADARSKE-2]